MKNGSKAVAKKKSTEVANWKKELADMAKEERERVPVGSGNRIQLTKRQQFRQQGADIGSEIEVVIVGHVYNNTFYDRPFDEANPTPPACFAQSVSGKNMAPLDESPKKQAEICEDCWANQWKSDKRGKGKACGNKHLTAVVMAEDLDEDQPEVYFLTVPVTSGATFRKYVAGLNDNDMPSWAVVTNISFDDGADYQKIKFALSEEVNEDRLALCKKLSQESVKRLMEKPDFSGYVAPAGGKAAKQKRSRLS